MGTIIGILLCLVLGCVTAFSDDFCDPKLCANCANGGPIPRHVACPASGPSACPSNAREIPLSVELQQLILDEHNKIRCKAAGGQLRGFSPCDRMIEMTWCPKLAYVAGFNARKCTFAHDKCRNTLEYPFSGQNIAIISSSDDFIEIRAAIKQMFDMWANEWKDCPMRVINAYASIGGPQIGHFTQIVNNKASTVGCSVMGWRGTNGATTYLVCNYGLTNMSGQKIYTIGRPASGCTAGVSARYPFLCNPDECHSLKPHPYGYVEPNACPSSSASASAYSSSSGSNDGGAEAEPQSHSSNPQVITYVSKPRVITYESKPQIITYETSPNGVRTITHTSGNAPPFDMSSFDQFDTEHGGHGDVSTVSKRKLDDGTEVTITRTMRRSGGTFVNSGPQFRSRRFFW